MRGRFGEKDQRLPFDPVKVENPVSHPDGSAE